VHQPLASHGWADFAHVLPDSPNLNLGLPRYAHTTGGNEEMTPEFDACSSGRALGEQVPQIEHRGVGATGEGSVQESRQAALRVQEIPLTPEMRKALSVTREVSIPSAAAPAASCAMCTDPDGEPCFPTYGVAPHICFMQIPGAKPGESQPVPREQWPANFREDPACPGLGTYWCPHCGSGKPA
jgi:hypothetical protein